MHIELEVIFSPVVMSGQLIAVVVSQQLTYWHSKQFLEYCFMDITALPQLFQLSAIG